MTPRTDLDARIATARKGTIGRDAMIESPKQRGFWEDGMPGKGGKGLAKFDVGSGVKAIFWSNERTLLQAPTFSEKNDTSTAKEWHSITN